MLNQATPSDPASERNYPIAIGVLLLLIVYGSLYPLTWNFAKPQDFIYLGSVGVVDLLENVVLFLPLGWLLAWRYHGKPNHWIIFGIWFVIALVVASVLQWLQKYLPRTPALADISMASRKTSPAASGRRLPNAHLIRPCVISAN